MFVDVLEEIEQLDPAATQAEIARVDEVLRRNEARMAALVRKAERDRSHASDGHASIRGWLRAERRWSDGDTTARLRLAHLVDDLPEVLSGLHDGVVGVAQARAFGRAHANPRCGEQLAGHAEVLLGHARNLCYEDFHLCIRRWELLADADGSHKDAEATHESRHVSIAEHDGVGHILGQGGALDTAEMIEILGHYCDAEFTADWEATKAEHGDDACFALMPRTDGQRRWDALKQIFLDAAATPADAQRPEPTLNLVMDQSTFESTLARMGLIPEAAESPEPTLGDVPVDQWRSDTTDGTLVEPVQAVLAALHGHIRRVVFDSAGNVIDLGRRRRLFTGAARQAVLLQALRCVWPGCTLRAGRCQADHTTDWQHDGTTRPGNGGPLCGRHNRLKNHGYRVWRDERGRWHTYRPDGTEIAA